MAPATRSHRVGTGVLVQGPKGKPAQVSAAFSGLFLALIRREPAAPALDTADAYLLIVLRALRRIAEHRVGMVDQGHAGSCVRIAGIPVGMTFLDEAAVRGLDDGRTRFGADLEDLVQVGRLMQGSGSLRVGTTFVLAQRMHCTAVGRIRHALHAFPPENPAPAPARPSLWRRVPPVHQRTGAGVCARRRVPQDRSEYGPDARASMISRAGC